MPLSLNAHCSMMALIIPFIFFSLGILLLIYGAKWLVDGASTLAKSYQVSDLTIGLTVVAFGTSMPELVVNVLAAWQGHPDVVFGNVIGSNNFNLFFILGLTGIFSPLMVQSTTVWKEIPLSILAAAMLYLLVNLDGQSRGFMLSRTDGWLLLLLFGLFMFYIYRQLKNENQTAPIAFEPAPKHKTWLSVVGGLIALILGGQWVVENAIIFAKTLGASEKLISLTIIAAGTSLPELMTSLVAIRRKNNDIAVGNVIGSNIFNIALILGLSAVIKPVSYDPKFNTDLILLMLGTAFLFIAMFIGKKKRLDRWQAAILLLVFLSYSIYLIKMEA